MPVHIARGNTSWDNDDHVIVRSAELINALIEDKRTVIDFLSQSISPIKLDEITIDEHGCVVISNAAFKQKVEAGLPGGPGGSSINNIGCGGGC